MSNINIKCPKCGSPDFKVPSLELKPTDKVVCAKCGFSKTYQQVLAPTVDRIKKDALDSIKKAFEGLH